MIATAPRRKGALIANLREEEAVLGREREALRALAESLPGGREPSSGRRVAVVLSGGGARGAYQAGVLLAFQDGRVPTHILAATSIGSINAASYAAGSTTLVGDAQPLVRAWLDLSASALGLEWTRYVLLLAGFIAATVGFGNLLRSWLTARGVAFVHLHDPNLTWLFMGLAGISIMLLYDRLPYLGYAARQLLLRRSWKPAKKKLAHSILAHAAVWSLIFVVLRPAHFHTSIAEILARRPAAAAVAATAAIALLYRRFLRGLANDLSHKFLRLPFRTGLFSNFERTRFLLGRIAADRLRASPMRVVIAATDVEDGTARFFSNASRQVLAADRGADSAFVGEIEPGEDLMRAVIASSALPIVYEAVMLGSRLYTDGSIAASAPIRPAICLGADAMFVVMTHPSAQESGEIRTFLDLGLRALDIVMAQNLRRDMKLLNDMNLLCEKHAAASGVRPEQIRVVIGARSYRYLRVFTVCPDRPLNASLVDFEGATAGQLILQGYRDGAKAVPAFWAYCAEAPSDGPNHVVALSPDQTS